MTANNIVLAIAATKNDLADEPTTSELVPPQKAQELAASAGAIFIDTSARNDENVNLLFQQVAERVLFVRQHSRSSGLGGGEDGHMNSIPVTPGASVNELGKVVKSYPHTGELRSINTRQINEDIYSPEQLKDLDTTKRSSIVMDEDLTPKNSSMGLCMGPLMECASNKGESSMCIIS